MCVVCGCDSNVRHERTPGDGQDAKGLLHYGAGEAGCSVPGATQERVVRLAENVLGENNRLAALNRAHFRSHGVTALNFVSSPGSGKTTLLCATINELQVRAAHSEIAVIEGDQQTQLDADRIRATGVPAIQVNTGKGCHLDAQMVTEAFERLPLHGHGHHHHGDHSHGGSEDRPHFLFIENVGNLVCPAMWDLGEAAKIAILSVTEGEDKPLKYPDMFAAASLMIINKIDLLPYVNFNVSKCIEFARRVNPGIEVAEVSAVRGEGMDAWIDWLLSRAGHHRDDFGAENHVLRRRVEELEARLAKIQHT